LRICIETLRIRILTVENMCSNDLLLRICVEMTLENICLVTLRICSETLKICVVTIENMCSNNWFLRTRIEMTVENT